APIIAAVYSAPRAGPRIGSGAVEIRRGVAGPGADFGRGGMARLDLERVAQGAGGNARGAGDARRQVEAREERAVAVQVGRHVDVVRFLGGRGVAGITLDARLVCLALARAEDRDRDRGERADDRDHDQQLDQREARICRASPAHTPGRSNLDASRPIADSRRFPEWACRGGVMGVTAATAQGYPERLPERSILTITPAHAAPVPGTRARTLQPRDSARS